MVAIGSNSCHKCGSAANLLTHRFQDGKTVYVFCQKCWASELVTTEQSPVQNQDEHPACQAVDEPGSPCSPCLVVEGIEKTYPTAKKFVVITKENMEEIEPGAHLAYTMNKFGFIYWHEFFVHSVDWEKGSMMVYEKNKKPTRGMEYNPMTISDLLEKQLCRKFIYDECLPFEESVKLAEKMVGDKKYNPITDNCEHSARYLKTGRKESKQVENACVHALNMLYSIVPKFLRAGPFERSLTSTVAEILVGEVTQHLASHISALALIGTEGIAAIVVYLIIYMVNIVKLTKELKEHEISDDNFEDLRTILRYKLSGAALGSLIGILVASPAGVFGFKGIALGCFAGFICSLIFSVILKNAAFWVVRRRNEKRSKTRNILMATHKE